MAGPLAALAVLSLIALASPAKEEKGKSRADRVQLSPSASAIAADGTQTITVTLKIDEGWVIYANAVGNEDLEEVRTVLNVTGERGLEQLSVEYPPGDAITNPVGGNYNVYTGEVSVKVKVRRAKADRRPLSITVHFYPFDGKTCGTVEKQTVTLR
jgi:DsbC/DsbD-like thiol-disulfide interchange protein